MNRTAKKWPCVSTFMGAFRLMIVLWSFAMWPVAAQQDLRVVPHMKPRLLVLTDISNEPDDEESMVRLLIYSDQFDIEGLVATTSAWLKTNPREDLIRRAVAAYGEVRTNLLKHADGFPSAESLLAVSKTGQSQFGMAAVGHGKSTPGSQRVIDAADRVDTAASD